MGNFIILIFAVSKQQTMLQTNTYHQKNYKDSIYKEQARQRIVPFTKDCKIGASLSGTSFKTEQKLDHMQDIIAFEKDKKEYQIGTDILKQMQSNNICSNVSFLHGSIFNINPTEFDFINFDLTNVVSNMTINILLTKLQWFKGTVFITLAERIRNCGILDQLDDYLETVSGNRAKDMKELARVSFPKIIQAHTDLKLVDIFPYANKDISAKATPMIQLGFKNM